jgi:hypothetical protein
MKKVTIILGILFLLSNASFAEITGDISDSTVEILGSDSIKISDISVTGLPGTYWAEFQWNSSKLVFELINYGQGETHEGVTINYPDGSFKIILTTDPINRIMTLEVIGISGNPEFRYQEITFAQNNVLIFVGPEFNDNTALISGFVEGEISSGVHETATITDIPLGFDVGSSFVFRYDGRSFFIE